jgi:CheY-like chemotaxis protein
MTKETQEHMFEPFFSTKEIGRGTGLGLAMVYGIVQQHGGSIHCVSEVNSGTTFEIYFPAVRAAAEPSDTQYRKMPAGGTETILVVDDEDPVRDLAHRTLSRAGYRVLTAVDGPQALELYRENGDDISLVILDLIMPSMGGAECLAELLKLDPGVRVLIASGYSGEVTEGEALERGARGFLGKPFQQEELLQQVRLTLDGN